MATIAAHVERVTLNGQRFVIIPEAEFEQIIHPPEATKKARNVNALQFAETSIAEEIIRRRIAANMSQKELAEAAGIRVEVLNRAERRVVVPSTATLTKIDTALKAKGF